MTYHKKPYQFLHACFYSVVGFVYRRTIHCAGNTVYVLVWLYRGLGVEEGRGDILVHKYSQLIRFGWQEEEGNILY